MYKIIFTKYSNERAARFALRTDILEEDGKRFVRKSPFHEEGQAHIERIARWYRELSSRYADTGIRLNVCEQDKDGLILEYLEGGTLEHVLDGYLLAGETEKLTKLLFAYLEEVKRGFTVPSFTMTPEFEEVFGPVSLEENLLCSEVADIDMVLNNVLIKDGWTLIDYEWTFDFPIPYHFVVYRILHYYLNGSTSRNCLHELDLYTRAGLTEEEIDAYEKMERHFQEVYVVSEGPSGRKHTPVRELYDEISPGTVDLTGLRFQEQSERAARMVQLYEAQDLNFTEERSALKEPQEEGAFRHTFLLKEESGYVRLDPCSKYCIVRELELVWGSPVRPCGMNGILLEDGSILFASEDPQMIVKKPADAGNEIRVSFAVEYLDQEAALNKLQESCMKQSGELQRLQALLAQKEALIHEMENTKVWKAYRKLKGKGK